MVLGATKRRRNITFWNVAGSDPRALSRRLDRFFSCFWWRLTQPSAMSPLQKVFTLVLFVSLGAKTTLPFPTTEEDIPIEEADGDSSMAPEQTDMPVNATADPAQPRPLPTQYKNEPSCLRQGGLCIKKEECPSGQLHATAGLCPEQAHLGVECCHGLSVKERRCSARGGECRPRSKCGRQLWEERAEDCGASEACCILTRIL